ncbi:aldehyde dehydrogenase family protein [Amycolatopsis thermoflava]|uniref:aldehyde dehydrogenase family protein n=1 Tax=Amycolatopsis thermoflava TaxID=84480 RepID=UPI003EB6EE9F
MRYAPPGLPGSSVPVLPRYDNFIGGKWLAPTEGRYRSVISPATARTICETADSSAADLELALDAAHVARDAWGECTHVRRAEILTAAADAIEDNAEMLAVCESWETGRPIREALGVDIPLAADHFRYFAEVVRGDEAIVSGIDDDVLAYQFREPLGVVAQFLPVHFPVLVAAWNLAPALAAGNCSVVKPASDASWSVLKLAEVIGEVIPPGVFNIVTGRGEGVGRDLASSRRIAKVVFSGETATGRRILSCAAPNLVPVWLDVGARSPNVFFADVPADEDGFLDRAVDAMVRSASDEGLVCTCPSRALVQEPVYDEFVGRALERIAELVVDDPLDTATRVGPRGGPEQLARLESCVDTGRSEGATVLIGGHRVTVGDEFTDGYFYAPTVLQGHNRMRVFREDLFGPVLAVTSFTDEEQAIAIANDSRNGPGAGVWTRDGDRAYRVGGAVKASRVWTNCYHRYSAAATYACTPATGVGRETHRLVLDQYSQMKSLVVSHGRRYSGPLAG